MAMTAVGEVAEPATKRVATKRRSGEAPEPPTSTGSGRSLRDLAAMFEGPERRERPRAEGPAAFAAQALQTAVLTRSPDLGASSALGRRIATTLGQRLGLRAASLAKLDLAVQVHDAGMIALPDRVLDPGQPLGPDDWELINRHPLTSADMCSEVAPLAAVAEIVLAHHERWDGQGYPNGLSRDAIPIESRIIAVADGFASMALGRPHRPGVGPEMALEQIAAGAGTQFDPAVVDALMSARSPRPQPVEAPAPVGHLAARRAPRFTAGQEEEGSARFSMRDAIAGVQQIPALAPAQERLLVELDAPAGLDSDLVSAIESDVGLTLAVLRQAQGAGDGAPGAMTVPEAVSVLGREGVRAAATRVPVSEFHWGTTRAGGVLQRFRVHALAVARAAASLSREAGGVDPDAVLTGALLHDIGKLVLLRAHAGYPAAILGKAKTPEQRLQQERRAFGVDHAAIGGLLLTRWGLPRRLAMIVSSHHESDEPGESAVVRLADTLAHRAQDHDVDRRAMLRLSYACGVHPQRLRAILFELPHSGGSQRRRAEPSPLSPRETDALRLLGEGKVYEDIARDLEVSTSTVRSHLHSAYRKLGVADRAQAVLRAAERGWL